QDPYVDFLK
nr:RecName: Full=57 kDa cell wall protein [Nicotiana tabacum]